jgi:hypothetical protein
METGTITIGLIIAVVVITLIGLARRKPRARDLRNSQWLRAEGEVLGVWQDGAGPYCVRYRFTPEGTVASITRDEIAGCLRASLPEVGERVPVRYDPEAPMLARLQDKGC